MNKARADKRFRETKAQSDARGVRTLIHETTHPRDDGRSQNQARAEPKQHRVRYSVCADKNTGTRVHSDTEKQRVVQTNSQHSKEIHYRLITTKSPEEYHPEAMARFATGGRLRAVVGDGSSRPFGCASCSSGVLLVEGGGEVDLRCGNVREADAATRWDSIAGGLETPHIERDSLEELDLETDVLETCEIEANRNGVPHFSNATRRPYTGRATTMGINPYPEYVTHETPECHATPAVQQVHSQMLFQPQDGRVEMLRGEAVVRSSSGSAVCAVSHPMQASHQLPWENNIQGLPATIRTSFSESDICMPNALLEKQYNRVTRESLEAEGITYDGSKTRRSDGKWPAVIPLAETPERDLARQKIGVPLDPHGRAGTTDDPVKENSFTMLDDVSTSKQSSAVTSTSKANMSTTVKRAPERRTSHAGVTARKDFVKMNVMSLGRTDEGKTSYLNMYRKVQKLKRFERAESEHENLHNTNAKSNDNSAIVTRSDEGDGGETKMEGGGKKCLKGLNLEFEENDCSKTEEFKKQHGEGKNFQSADAFGKKTLRDEDEDEKEEEEKSTVGAKKTSASISPSNSGTSTSQIKDCSFKQYTLHDYRLLDLQINLGRLDPEPCDVNEHDRLQRRKDYGREIKIRNQEELSLSKGSTCTFGKQPQVQVSRRRQALSYAKTVPLPKAGKGCARGEWVLNRIPTDSILERGSHLDVLHRRHEHEKSIVAKFGRMI